MSMLQRLVHVPCVFPAMLAAMLAVASPARAASEARVIDTDPSRSATLGRQQAFHVRMEYRTDEPITLWARPYLDGHAVETAMSNASEKYSGSGEALGWFALTEPGAVDEVRIIAGGSQPYREWEIAREPVQLHWSAGEAPSGSAQPWVGELSAAAEARQREEAQRRASEPVSGGDIAFFSGFMLLVLGSGIAGIAVPVRSMWKWRGGWRIAAAVPVAILAFVVLRIVIDTARDPTSHNLWPFEIVMFGLLALGIIAALKIARRLTGAEA